MWDMGEAWKVCRSFNSRENTPDSFDRPLNWAMPEEVRRNDSWYSGDMRAHTHTACPPKSVKYSVATCSYSHITARRGMYVNGGMVVHGALAPSHSHLPFVLFHLATLLHKGRKLNFRGMTIQIKLWFVTNI